MDAITLLKSRNSASRLCAPGPDDAALAEIFAAASRAPDHGRLRPWRFLLVREESLVSLGNLFAEAAKQRDPQVSESDCQRFRQQPLRAPCIMVVIARIEDHPKIPLIEQRMSAACAAYGALLAAEALGYAGIWRTGINAFDATVNNGLGLADNEEVTGFLYVGTRDGQAKPLPVIAQSDFMKEWRK
ncbi:nitroreductase family protein [Zhongshania sp. BJYM1]|uniref:nitroreductase family protein n=1 Tax=Zhongshania aquatica TaxID=2965069 RepID=UPI0022B4CFF2|nr:nitroreductase [Marortus sp. BJYM1]